MPLAIGAAVKDRRRDQRATTTGRRLANGRESPSSPAGSLNRMFSSGQRRWCCPFWNVFLERPTPGTYVPDVTDGVAQDRKRQEP